MVLLSPLSEHQVEPFVLHTRYVICASAWDSLGDDGIGNY